MFGGEYSEAGERALPATTSVDFIPKPTDRDDVPATRSALPRNLGGIVLASLLLHLAIVAAATHFDGYLERRGRWELRLPTGSNSVMLTASVAGRRTVEERDIPVKPPSPQVSRAEPARRSAEVPDAPPPDALALNTERRVPAPPAADETRSDVEPPTAESFAVPRPKRTKLAEPAPTSVAAVASSSSAASAGAQTSKAPTAVYLVKPIYPPEALAAGIEGLVLLYVRVDARGLVVAAAVHQTSGHDTLDRAALAAIRRCRFTPPDATDGEAAEFLHPMRFRIDRSAVRR